MGLIWASEVPKGFPVIPRTGIKGLTNFRVLRMCGNMLSEATKLRALCFLKLFLLVLIVSSEN